jgi:hypothetical protein
MNPPESIRQQLHDDPALAAHELEVARALGACRARLEVSLSGLQEDLPRRGALDGLQSAVAGFASLTRRLDMPPERVIVLFKRMVRDLAAIQRWRSTEREALTGELVQVMIEAYYAGPRRDGPSPDEQQSD